MTLCYLKHKQALKIGDKIMARTIGKQNKTVIRKTTHDEMKKGWENRTELEKRIIDKLPYEMWETWEAAHQEIIGLIDDAIMNF